TSLATLPATGVAPAGRIVPGRGGRIKASTGGRDGGPVVSGLGPGGAAGDAGRDLSRARRGQAVRHRRRRVRGVPRGRDLPGGSGAGVGGGGAGVPGRPAAARGLADALVGGGAVPGDARGALRRPRGERLLRVSGPGRVGVRVPPRAARGARLSLPFGRGQALGG